jgi:hypothetical protein
MITQRSGFGTDVDPGESATVTTECEAGRFLLVAASPLALCAWPSLARDAMVQPGGRSPFTTRRTNRVHLGRV